MCLTHHVMEAVAKSGHDVGSSAGRRPRLLDGPCFNLLRPVQWVAHLLDKRKVSSSIPGRDTNRSLGLHQEGNLPHNSAQSNIPPPPTLNIPAWKPLNKGAATSFS